MSAQAPGVAPETALKWIDGPRDARRAAAALASWIVQDPAYICFEEYADGLSPDGRNWAPDAQARLARSVADRASGEAPLLAWEAAGDLIAVVVVRFGETAVERYAVIEDFAVAPAHRGAGRGRAFLSAVLDALAGRGVARVFLDAGRRNAGARALFEDAGFEPLSTCSTLALKGRRRP